LSLKIFIRYSFSPSTKSKKEVENYQRLERKKTFLQRQTNVKRISLSKFFSAGGGEIMEWKTALKN
jgi:hypothetical protein